MQYLIPGEIWCYIFEYVNFSDLHALYKTCHTFHSLIRKKDMIQKFVKEQEMKRDYVKQIIEEKAVISEDIMEFLLQNPQEFTIIANISIFSKNDKPVFSRCCNTRLKRKDVIEELFDIIQMHMNLHQVIEKCIRLQYNQIQVTITVIIIDLLSGIQDTLHEEEFIIEMPKMSYRDLTRLKNGVYE